MIRFLTVLSILIGFLLAQASHAVNINGLYLWPVERCFSTASDYQPIDDSDPIVSIDDDEEESDASHHSDDPKFLVSQFRFQFVFSHMKALWINTHFVPWLFSSDFERPPKLIS